jgi:hypothetical protein
VECKITYKGKEYRLPEFAQYLADEGIAEAIKNNVIKEAKFIKAYEKLFVAPKAVQPSEKKITQPQAEIQFKVNKIAEDDAENKHAEQQLQKEDNIEQEPNVQAIERQAESNDKAELEEVIKKVEEIINIATDVQVVDVASISTDEARFQNREELDEERVNKIAEGWSDAEQDPIHVWRDEKDGKLYVLSGHHRLQAAKKANRKTVKIIDRTNDFTEERAIKFATEEANTNRAMETPLERAKIYRSDIEKGMSSKELEDKAKRLEGKNSIYILALAYLNPKGRVMNMLNSLKENTDKENIRQAEKIAQWVGEARKRFDLTNEHENELYDALIDEMFSKRIKNKVDFLQKVGSIVGEIEYDKNKPLNIRRFREVSAGQEEYDRLTSEIKSQIESKMSEVQDIRIRFTDPSASNYIPSTAKDYEQAKENADNKIASINAEIRALQSKLQELIRNKGKYLRAPQTGSLFDFQQIKKRLNTISPKLFNKLLQRLKKAFPKAKLNTFKESDLEAMLPEMSAEPVIGGIKYKKDATMPRATSIVKMKAVDLTNELDKNNFGKRLTRTLSKEASDKIDIAKENIQKAQKDNSIITSPIQVGYVLTEDGRVELQVLKGQEYLAAMQELGIEELAIEIPNSDLKTLQDRFETPVQKALKRHGFTAEYSAIGKFRDDKHFPFSQLKYPDVVFKDIQTEQEAKIAVEFYERIVKRFNKIFDRNVKVSSSIDEQGNFHVEIEYETGLKPKYYAYPTATMGQHEIVSDLDKNVPMTSLRHELIHEMLVKHITEKFERINTLDESAFAESIEEVQRNRAYNYTLEDVFFERVVENIERVPDGADTFEINTYGTDVTNRLKQELGGKKPTKAAVSKILDDLLEGSNKWLENTLKEYFANRVDYEKITDITDVAEELGKYFANRYKGSKNIFNEDLQYKIYEWTNQFNESYKGMLTKLSKAKQKDKSTEENVQFFRLKDGTIYGFKTPDGQVFINEDKMNANTPIHEYGHVWQSMFPTEFARGIELLKASKKGQKLIKEISQNLAYKDKTQQEIEAEALVTAIGDMGESYFEGNHLTRFIDWVKDLFRKIGQRFGVQITPDTTLDMFTRDVVRQMLGGKELLAEEDEDGFFEMMINGVPTKVKNMGVDVINGFYSPIEKRLAETKIEKQSANKWLTVIGKGDEATWTGVKAWLESKNPQEQVSKSEILQWMKDNRISVVEVVKGDDLPQSIKVFAKSEAIKKIKRGEEVYAVSNDNGYPEAVGEPMTIEEAKDWWGDFTSEYETGIAINTKFSQYQLEGEKENYKEVLVTLPDRKKNIFGKESETLDYARETYGINSAEYRSVKRQFENRLEDDYGFSYTQIKELFNEYEKTPDVFKSTHFDEPNILVHLRMNTRTDAEGNKVLFIEEFQRDVEKETDLGEKEAGLPFSKTTDYVKLAWKVALKEAVKQGADKIAWTTGEQQNERYDLSKQVKDIQYNKNSIDDSFNIVVKGINGEKLYSNEAALPSEIEATLGKDILTKMQNNEGENVIGKVNVLKGENLKVGGKGMKGFYGSPTEGSLGIVGNVAKSLTKQEVGTVEMSIGTKDADYNWSVDSDGIDYVEYNGERYEFKNEEEAQKFVDNIKTGTSIQHSIDITPELKAEVEEGLPLFHRTTITKEDIKTIVKEQIDKQIESGVNKEEAISNILDEIRKKNIYIRLLNNNEINDLEFEKEIKEDYGISKVESGKQKAHRVIKRIITESEVVSNEQKEKLLEDEDSYYMVLTTDMIKALSKEIIDKLGIDEALRIVNDNDENYSLPIRGMLMGQLISHYQEQYNKIRGTSKVEEVSAAELEIGEKLHTLQQKLANEATLAGQFIYHIRTIYQMSGFAIETKVKRMIDESNKADGKDADKTIKELRELLMDKKAAIESALESFQKEQEGETKSLKEQIQLLEKEISELKLKADGRDVSKRTGAKGNPIKIKRYTDKDKAEEIKKKLFGKTRIGIGDLDELGYLSLYYIEELLSYGSAKIDGVIGKYDKRYYNKNKQEVIDAYVNARDVAIEQGVSEELLSTDEEITDYLGAQEQERVAKEIAKKQAQLLKLRNKLAAENNPDSARKQAPVEAAKMVVSDTKTILNLKDTKNEGTYLKKLVRLLHAKAKEKYKEKNKKEPKSILETIAFALENASSQRELWDGLINSIEQQIDNDENLSEAEKDSVKDFIETYVEQMIDTLVTESNQERLINEILKEKFGKEKKLPTPISREEARKTLSNKKAKLVDENGSPITTAQQINSANQIFKVITSIDWKDILRNENSINEINDKIDEVIDGTGITGAEVELFKQKLKDRFALRYQDVVEKKVAQFLNERNRGKLPKAFSGLSRNARKIAKLESAGILSDDRIKEVLQETLGIRSLTDGDVRYIRDLVNRIKTESKIMFYKEKLEEELQYFIKKKTDSTIWGFLNDQTAVGQFGSATNFVQNLSNVFEQIPVIVRTIAALKSPKLAMQILAEAYKESMQISKTIFVTGDVGRGVAFTDILGTREGQPRVRYLEYFKPTGIYGQMFGKKINLLPTTTTKNISKYVLRLFEAVDVYTSAVVAQMSTAIYLKKRLMAQGMTEAQATRKIRAMYLENNFAQDMRDSEKELKKQGLKQPTQAQIKRGAYELAERRRNEEDENKFAVRLGETLGQILTGKKTQTGLMNLPYIAADAVMRKFKGIKTEGAKEEVGSTSWRTIKAGGGYLIDRVAFPFFKAISNFTELAIEWTPYGIAKGAFYSASGIARAKYFKTTPYEIAENQHYAVNVTVKSIMGTVIYYAITNMLFGGGDDEEDKMKINAPSYGLDPYQKERVEDLVQAPKTLGVKDKTPIPLDMFGTLGGGMYMYEAANQAIQKAIDDAYSRIGGKDNIKKMNEEQKQEFENMKMEMVSKYLFTAMSGVTFDLRDSYFRRLTKPDMSIIGKPLGSLVVPLNAVQKEIGMYINPLTRESKGMANFVNNFSIMKAFDTSKPALDWRGREYKQYEVYPNNVIGLFNMMKENKYTDELDIAFADMGMSLKNNSQYTIDIERNKVTINGLPLTDRQFEMYDREYKIAIGKQLSNNKNQILYDYRNKKYDIVDKRLSIYKQLARATALANVKKAEIQLNK